jgi:hypothetical protein
MPLENDRVCDSNSKPFSGHVPDKKRSYRDCEHTSCMVQYVESLHVVLRCRRLVANRVGDSGKRQSVPRVSAIPATLTVRIAHGARASANATQSRSSWPCQLLSTTDACRPASRPVADRSLTIGCHQRHFGHRQLCQPCDLENLVDGVRLRLQDLR